MFLSLYSFTELHIFPYVELQLLPVHTREDGYHAPCSLPTIPAPRSHQITLQAATCLILPLSSSTSKTCKTSGLGQP